MVETILDQTKIESSSSTVLSLFMIADSENNNDSLNKKVIINIFSFNWKYANHHDLIMI